MGDRLLVEDPKLSSQRAQTVRKSRLCAQVVNYFTFSNHLSHVRK